MTSPMIVDPKKLAASGLPTHLQVLITQLVKLANRPVVKGAPGASGPGISSVTADPATGALTITLTTGAVTQTGPLAGADGASAYELAVQDGFVGTLTEWLDSLQGTGGGDVSQEDIDAILSSARAATDEAVAALRDGKRNSADVVKLITIDDDTQTRDVLTLLPEGLLGRMAPAMADQALDVGAASLGPLLVDGGRDLMTMHGQPLIRIYPDGIDFRRHGGDPGDVSRDGWAKGGDGSITAQAGQHGVMAVDRFIDRADGVRLPVAMVNGQTRKAVIVSSFGQSNADVARMADPLVWDTPPLPHHAMMLDDMNAFGSGTLRGGMMGWQGVAVVRGSRMIAASEALRGTQSVASAAWARLSMWDGPLRRVGLVRSSAWGGNRLRGTSIGTGIWRDSAGNTTQSWANWTGDIRQAHELLTAAGYQVEAVYILFTHQEADWQTPGADYLTDFLAMKDERETAIDMDFPGLPVHWFCDQASGSGQRSGTYEGGKWPSRLAIVDACREEVGGDNITMVTPRYWFPTGAEYGQTSNTNVIHHTHAIRPIWGELVAHAMRARERAIPWRCPIMSSATVSGNDIIVDYDSLLPLMIDRTFCKVRPDAGFTIGEGAIAVTDVRQTGQRQITVTAASDPIGTSIEYCWRRQDGGDVLDQWPICTGAIRDAWTAPSYFDPAGRPLVRAALAYQLPL